MGAYYGLGLGLGGAPVPIRGSHIAVGGSYVSLGRVLDLTTPFNELTFTLDDRSGEGNDATLYSGRYISTDGSTDRGIVADCSAAGAGSYYLTGKVRPNAVTTAELTMDGSTDSGLTGLTADVWQTFTTATSAVTPSAVQVGYDGSTASAADWSDVRLIDSSDGSTVARWQLNESADGDLNGYPALDSSGNGYHGTHTGCAGGTGEAGILQTAGMDWNKRMWFDGVDDAVTIPTQTIGTGDFNFTFICYSDWVGASRDGAHFLASSAGGTGRLTYDKTGGFFVIDSAASASTITGVAPVNELCTIRFARVSGTGQVWVNGVSQGTVNASAHNLTGIDLLGAQWGATTSVPFFKGLLTSEIGGVVYGLSNNGTVNGSPSNYLIPASDATPTNDALGNAIAEPRVNIKVVNIFDTETVDLPDNASLETVRSVTLAVYNDGGTKDVLQASGGASFVDIAANTLQTDQTGTHTYYVNGSATTTLAAGWNIVTIVFDAGKDLSGGKITAISGSLLAYDPTALTADQATQNYNAFKSQYGL